MTEVNDQHIEELFESIKKTAALARREELRDVEALIERIRVAMMIEPLSRPRKALYRAIIDYYEDILEERYDQAEHERGAARRSVVDYFKRLADSLDPKD